MPIQRLALALALGTPTLLAQTPACESVNGLNNIVGTGITASPFSGLNPSRYAYRFSPANPIVVEAAATYTDATPSGVERYLRIEIWSDDGHGQTPTAILGRGTCKVRLSEKWYGVNLDTPVVLNPGTDYWFCVAQPGFIRTFEQPGGTSLPRRIATRATPAWGNTTSGEIKFRLFCGRLDSASVTPTGAACSNSLGQLGTVFTNDAATVGNSDFLIEGTNLPGGANATLLIGFNLALPSIDLGPIGLPAGCFLHTDAAVSVSGTVGLAEIGDSGHPSPIGHVEFPVPIPASAASGLAFEAQIFAFDAGQSSAIQLISTNSIECTIQ